MIPALHPACLALAAAAAPQGAGHVRSVLPCDGELLDLRAADVDGDGQDDLLLALARDGARFLHLHRLRPDGALPATPDLRIELKADVVAWALADFWPEEPGAELLLVTRATAFVLSPRTGSYRDGRLATRGDFLLDLSGPSVLVYWPAVADVDGDGAADLVLPTVQGYLLASAAGVELGRVPVRLERERRPAVERLFRISPSVRISAQPLADLIVPDEDPGVLDPPPLLYAEEWLPMPWLADADGDGLLDLLYYDERQHGGLRVHRQRPPAAETGEDGPRFQPEPDLALRAAAEGDWDLTGIELVQAGGGPAVDLMITRAASDLDVRRDHQILLFLDPFAGGRGLARPDAAVTLDASYVRALLADCDGDGRSDLAASAWSLEFQPIGPRAVTIAHTVAAWLQQGDGRWSERADLRYERGYEADDFSAFSLVPALPGDLDGDGLPDLLESSARGDLELRPLQRAGGRLAFAAKPALTVPVDALQSTVRVLDLNRDGVGDLVLQRSRGSMLEVLVSRRS